MLTATSNTITETWREGILRLAHIYIDEYKKDRNYVNVLKNTKVPPQILKMVYNMLVSEKEIIPIEELTPLEKKVLAAEAGKCENLKDICKAIYVIKKILS